MNTKLLLLIAVLLLGMWASWQRHVTNSAMANAAIEGQPYNGPNSLF